VIAPIGDDTGMLKEIQETCGVRHAVLIGIDGLPLAQTGDTRRDTAQRLAAICYMMDSLGLNLAWEFGTVKERCQLTAKFHGGYALVCGVDDNCRLAVVVEPDADPESIVQRMQIITDRISSYASGK
jgi:predicted regulator of Ras-like GTPase activity (Roadblock/LC7/MglB family)